MVSKDEPCPIGRKLFSVSTDRRKAVIEQWRVTQHRGPANARRACLLRIDPVTPSSCPVRGYIDLQGPSSDTYATTLRSAIKKAITRTEARILRVIDYREEDKADDDIWRADTKEITEDRSAVTAMKKLLDAQSKEVPPMESL